MDNDTFLEIRDRAVELYEVQAKKNVHRISLDAIFIALANSPSDQSASKEGARPTATKGSEQPPADWFKQTLSELRGKGEAITISRFLLLSGRYPVKRMDQINVARWLREAGIEPRKSGGQLLFDL